MLLCSFATYRLRLELRLGQSDARRELVSSTCDGIKTVAFDTAPSCARGCVRENLFDSGCITGRLAFATIYHCLAATRSVHRTSPIFLISGEKISVNTRTEKRVQTCSWKMDSSLNHRLLGRRGLQSSPDHHLFGWRGMRFLPLQRRCCRDWHFAWHGTLSRDIIRRTERSETETCSRVRSKRTVKLFQTVNVFIFYFLTFFSFFYLVFQFCLVYAITGEVIVSYFWARQSLSVPLIFTFPPHVKSKSYKRFFFSQPDIILVPLTSLFWINKNQI